MISSPLVSPCFPYFPSPDQGRSHQPCANIRHLCLARPTAYIRRPSCREAQWSVKNVFPKGLIVMIPSPSQERSHESCLQTSVMGATLRRTFDTVPLVRAVLMVLFLEAPRFRYNHAKTSQIIIKFVIFLFKAHPPDAYLSPTLLSLLTLRNPPLLNTRNTFRSDI